MNIMYIFESIKQNYHLIEKYVYKGKIRFIQK